MVVSIHGCEFHAAVRLVDLDAFVLQRHGEAEFLLSIRRVAAQRLRNGQAAHVQRVGHPRRHASRSSIARGNGSGLVLMRRRVAVLAVVLLSHFVGRAYRQAGEGDRLAAFQRDGLLLRHRLPVDGSGERHALRRVELHRDVKRFKRVRRARSVPRHNLLYRQVAGVAGVEEGDGGRLVRNDSTFSVGRNGGHIALGLVIRFLHGVARARRDAAHRRRFAALQRQRRFRFVIVSVHGCEFHAAVRLVDFDAFVLQRHGEAELLLSIRRVAAQRLLNGQAAHVQRVGHPRRHICGLRGIRFDGSGLIGIRRRVAVLAVVLLGDFILRSRGQPGEGDGFASSQRKGLTPLRALRGCRFVERAIGMLLVAGSVAANKVPVRGRGQRNGNLKRGQCVRRTRSVSGHNLFYRQVADIALVGVGDRDVFILVDHAIAVCVARDNTARFITIGGIAVLGHGVGCTGRDAGQFLLFAVLERKGRASHMVVSVHGRECHAAVGVVDLNILVFQRHGEAEVLIRLAAIACDLLGNREAANIAGVGEHNRGRRGVGNHTGRVGGGCGHIAIGRIGGLLHSIDRTGGQARYGQLLAVLQGEGVRAVRAFGYGDFTASVGQVVAVGKGLARKRLAIRIRQRQREIERLVGVTGVASHGLCNAQAARDAVCEGNAGRRNGNAARICAIDDTTVGLRLSGRLVLHLHIHRDLSSSAGVTELHPDGVERFIVLDARNAALDLLQRVDVVARAGASGVAVFVKATLRPYVLIVVGKHVKGKRAVCRGGGGERLAAGEIRVVGGAEFKGIRAICQRPALKFLGSGNGQGATGHVIIVNGDRVLRRAGHVRSRIRLKHEALLASLNARHALRNLRVPRGNLKHIVAVRARHGILDDDVVGVGIEIAILVLKDRRASVCGGRDGRHKVARTYAGRHLVIRPVDMEYRARNIVRVIALLGDGEFARADQAQVVGHIAHTVGLEVEALGRPGGGVKVAVGAARVSTGVHSRHAAAVILLGDAVAFRRGGGKAIGEARGAHQARVVHIAIAVITRACVRAALRGSRIQAGEHILAERCRLGRRRSTFLLIGGKRDGHIRGREIVAVVLNAIGVFVDPHRIAQRDRVGHDRNHRIRAIVDSAQVVVEVGVVNRRIVVDRFACVRFLFARGLAGVGQCDRPARWEFGNYGEDGHGAGAPTIAEALRRRRAMPREYGVLVLRFVGIVNRPSRAADRNSAVQLRGPGAAAAIAGIRQRIADPQVGDGFLSIVGNANLIADGFTRFSNEGLVVTGRLAANRDKLVDGDAAGTGNANGSAGFQAQLARRDLFIHRGRNRIAVVIRKGYAVGVGRVLRNLVGAVNVGIVHKPSLLIVDQRHRLNPARNDERYGFARHQLALRLKRDHLAVGRDGVRNVEICGSCLRGDAEDFQPGGDDVADDGIGHAPGRTVIVAIGFALERNGVLQGIANRDHIIGQALIAPLVNLKLLCERGARQNQRRIDGDGILILRRDGRGLRLCADSAKVILDFKLCAIVDAGNGHDGFPAGLAGLNGDFHIASRKARMQAIDFLIRILIRNLHALCAFGNVDGGLAVGYSINHRLRPGSVRELEAYNSIRYHRISAGKQRVAAVVGHRINHQFGDAPIDLRTLVVGRGAAAHAELDILIGNHGGVDRQGQLVKAAERVGQFLTALRLQAADAVLIGLLGHRQVDFLGIGHVCEGDDGNASIVRNGDGLGGCPSVVRARIRRIEVALRPCFLSHDVLARNNLLRFGQRNGVIRAVRTLVVIALQGIARAGEIRVALLGLAGGIDRIALALGRRSRDAHDVEGRVQRQGGLIDQISLEDDDLGLGHVVGAYLDVCVFANQEVAFRVCRYLAAIDVHLRGAFHMGDGGCGFTDIVALVLSSQLAQVGEDDLARRVGGLGLDFLILHLAFVVHAGFVERELRARKEIGSSGVLLELSILGDGNLDARFVDDGFVARQGRRCPSGEGDLNVGYRVVGRGRGNLGQIELHACGGARHNVIGQLDIRKRGHAAAIGGNDCRRFVGAAPRAVRIIVSLRLAIELEPVEGEPYLLNRVAVGRIVYLLKLHSGEIANVGEGDCHGRIRVRRVNLDRHSAALVGSEPAVCGNVRSSRVGQGIPGVPVARGFLLNGVIAGGKLDGFAGFILCQRDRRFHSGALIDLERNATFRPIRATFESLADGQLAIAGVGDGGFSGCRAAELAVGNLEYHGIGKLMVGVGVGGNLGQLIPAGDEAGDFERAVFIRRHLNAGNLIHIRRERTGRRFLHGAGHRSGRQRFIINVVAGERREVQRELDARHGLRRVGVVRLDDRDRACAGVCKLNRLAGFTLSEGDGRLAAVEQQEVALFSGGKRFAIHMRLRDGIVAVRQGNGSLAVRFQPQGVLFRGVGGVGNFEGRILRVPLRVHLFDGQFAVLDVAERLVAFRRRIRVHHILGLGIPVCGKRVHRLVKYALVLHLVATGQLRFREVVGGIRFEGEGRAAGGIGRCGGDSRIDIVLQRIHGELRARKRRSRVRIGYVVANLVDDNRHERLLDVDNGAFIASCILRPNRIAAIFGVVFAVGGHMHQVCGVFRRGVVRPISFDQQEVCLVFILHYAVVVFLARNPGDIVRILIMEHMHPHRFGNGLARIVNSLAIWHVHAGGKAADDRDISDPFAIRVGQPNLERRIGQRGLCARGSILGYLVQFKLEIANRARAAMQGIVFHITGQRGALGIPRVEFRAQTLLKRNILHVHKSGRRFDFVEPVDIAARERAGNNLAGAGVSARAGFVNIIAQAVGQCIVRQEISFVFRFAQRRILFNRAAVELELGMVKRLRRRIFIVNISIHREVVLRLALLQRALRLIPLLHIDLNIFLHVGHVHRMRSGRRNPAEVEAGAIVGLQRVRQGHSRDLRNRTKASAIGSDIAVLVGKLEYSVCGHTVQVLKERLTVRAGFHRGDMLERVIFHDEQGQLRVCKRAVDLVVVHGIPLGIPRLVDGNGIHGDIVDGDSLCGGRALLIHERDLLLVAVENVAIRLLRFHHDIFILRFAISAQGGQVGNRHACLRGYSGDGPDVSIRVAGVYREARGRQLRFFSVRKAVRHADRNGDGRTRKVGIRLGVLLDNAKRGQAGVVLNCRCNLSVLFQRNWRVSVRRGSDDARREANFLDIVGAGVEGKRIAVGERIQRIAQAVGRYLGIGIPLFGIQFEGERTVFLRRVSNLFGHGERRLVVVFEVDGSGIQRVEREGGFQLGRSISAARRSARARDRHSAGVQIACRDARFGDGVFAAIKRRTV